MISEDDKEFLNNEEVHDDHEEPDEEIIINSPEISLYAINSSESLEDNNSTESSRPLTPENTNLKMAKIVKYITFKGTESEDPTEWFEDFERAANANRLDEGDRLTAAVGLLQDEAAAWYQENKAEGGMDTYSHAT